MSRRRHQGGNLIELQHGWAVRYYENSDRHRRRVQKFLGTRDQLTKPQAKTAMAEVLAAVNKNLTAQPRSTLTFRSAAKQWIQNCETRKRKPVKPSVLHNWRCILDNHLYAPLGDVPLSDVSNVTMRSLVEKLSTKKKKRGGGRLSPATIRNIVLVVKLVKSSARDEQGRKLFLEKWDHEFIDAPIVDKRKQRTPKFTADQVSAIAKAARGRLQMAAILFAATGLRAGELLGLECRHFDGASVKVEQAVWGGNNRPGTPKTENAYRVVDLHPDVAVLLQQFIGDRKKGFIFQSSSGQPVTQTNLLRREFHPLLDSLEIPRCGFHAFRRFRNTFLRNYTACPEGLLKFWIGHADRDMTDRYDKVKEDVQFRQDVARSVGVGFELPKALAPKRLTGEKITHSGANGRQAETAALEVTPC